MRQVTQSEAARPCDLSCSRSQPRRWGIQPSRIEGTSGIGRPGSPHRCGWALAREVERADQAPGAVAQLNLLALASELELAVERLTWLTPVFAAGEDEPPAPIETAAKSHWAGFCA